MLDLLFENPIIIGVVLYFIWVLFKPSKIEKKQPSNQHPMPHPYEEEKDDVPTYRVEPTKAEPEKKPTLTTPSSNSKPSRPKVTLTQSTNADTVQFDYAKEKQRLEERKKKAAEALTVLNASQLTTKSPSVTTSNVSRLQRASREQLREGVLWSEILGKPKAKR